MLINKSTLICLTSAKPRSTRTAISLSPKQRPVRPPANEADVEQVADLLHGKEEAVWADSGYRGAQGRVKRDDLQWHIAARPSDIAKLPEGRAKIRAQRLEHRKASIRAKVEHPFRVVKRQFGLQRVRFRGLQKNTAHLNDLGGRVTAVAASHAAG
ncbi:transposase [Variovorax sp. LjRoot130]|uniref:transposase n=1 Tax=Variovorax sp. LjRoot130 TaxID=3342261 RepID=UPI003F5153A1